MSVSVVEILNKRSSDRGVWNLIAVEEACKIGLSRGRFCARLKQETGLTFRQFKNRERLKAILEEFNDLNSKPLKAISLDRLGFRSYAHFATWFGRQTGMCPREYIRRHR